MAINFSFGTFLSWCGLLNKQCRFEALFARKKTFLTAFHYEGTARPFFVDYCQSHQKERFWLSMWISHLTYLVLIIGYVLWDNSPSGSTDFFILIECFDSQFFEQNTESLFSLKILRIKHPNTDLLDLQIKWAAHFHTFRKWLQTTSITTTVARPAGFLRSDGLSVETHMSDAQFIALCVILLSEFVFHK